MKESPLARALNPNKPLDRPLSQAEKWVINVLLSPTQGERPDDATRTLIINISQQSPSQWLTTATKHPEIVEALHSFLYGNLCERAAGKPCR